MNQSLLLGQREISTQNILRMYDRRNANAVSSAYEKNIYSVYSPNRPEIAYRIEMAKLHND